VRANAFASFVLYAWPFLVIAAYAVRCRSARVARTTAWMMILPVMFLPSRHDLAIAALNKHRIAFLSIAIALELFHRRELLSRAPWRHFPRVALLVLIFGATQTVRTNGDALWFGPLALPALTWRDAAWMAYGSFIDVYIPFAIGQRVFKTERDLLDLLDVLSICAVIYVPLCLFELRFSPQLHNWVYGYIPTDFVQARRGSGYRPVVFMNHGLSVAMFLFSGFAAALGLRRAGAAARRSAGSRAVVTGLLLAVGNSLASVLYSLVAMLFHFVRSNKALGRAVLVIALLVIAYPAMRASGVFPAQGIGEFFGQISKQRMDSLVFRFVNEDILLARAMERPVFGWGAWGRNRIIESWGSPGDEWAGFRDVSVTDGSWIIVLGMSGFVGFAGYFSFFLVPLLRFAHCVARMPARAQALLGTLALIVALFAVDLIPNAQSDLLPLAYAGALFTLSNRLRRKAAPSPAPFAVHRGEHHQPDRAVRADTHDVTLAAALPLGETWRRR
jgi:hypothetical protein